MNTRNFFIFPVVFLLFFSAVFLPSSAQENDPDRLYKEAVEYAKAREFQKAIDLFEKLLKQFPDDPDILWNSGLVYTNLMNHEKALEIWRHYREVEPEDWMGSAKIIQAFQALGKSDMVRIEREELLKWYKEIPVEQRPNEESFCRDQFQVDGRHVMSFEIFVPGGDRMVFFFFSLLDPEGNETVRYSLGSYETTTAFARESGSIKQDQRLYHLDMYTVSGHATLGMFNEMPGYDDVKTMVISHIKKELNPISSTTIRK